MDYGDACKAIDVMRDSGIDQINLIGGEPTCYPYLLDIIEYCNTNHIETCLVTNGVKLSDISYVKKLKESGLTFLSISIKGESEKSYVLNTKHAAFGSVMRAIKNVSEVGINFSVSYVITLDNIDNMVPLFEKCKNYGAHWFDTSFCNPYFHKGVMVKPMDDPLMLINRFVEVYPEIEKLNCEFSFHLDSPMCLWPDGFIENMAKKGQVQSLCQLQKKSGLMLTPDLEILMCNSLPNYPIGKFGVDFETSDELKCYMNSNEVTEVFKKMLRSPSRRCRLCEKMKLCGGGCVLWWMVYDLDELLDNKEKRIHNNEDHS